MYEAKVGKLVDYNNKIDMVEYMTWIDSQLIAMLLIINNDNH